MTNFSFWSLPSWRRVSMNSGTLFSRCSHVLVPPTSRCRSVMCAKLNFGMSAASAKGMNWSPNSGAAVTAAPARAMFFMKFRRFMDWLPVKDV